MSTTSKAIFGAVMVGLLHCGAAVAEESKIYKHVDEMGNVSYSQVPPTTGGTVRKLDAQPAYRGLGGYSGSGSPYDDPRISSEDHRQDEYKSAVQRRQQQMDDATTKRLAELEAECNRNRGTDCKNPDTLRYIDSTKIPRVYRR
jgi:hypothetical protein